MAKSGAQRGPKEVKWLLLSQYNTPYRPCVVHCCYLFMCSVVSWEHFKSTSMPPAARRGGGGVLLFSNGLVTCLQCRASYLHSAFSDEKCKPVFEASGQKAKVRMQPWKKEEDSGSLPPLILIILWAVLTICKSKWG